MEQNERSNQSIARLLQDLGWPAEQAEAIATEVAATPGARANLPPQAYEEAAGLMPGISVVATSAKAAAIAEFQRSELLRLRAQAASDCSGVDCSIGCGVGCVAGCAIGGGALVGFGAAAGTAAGAGTSKALSITGDLTLVRQMFIAPSGA